MYITTRIIQLQRGRSLWTDSRDKFQEKYAIFFPVFLSIYSSSSWLMPVLFCINLSHTVPFSLASVMPMCRYIPTPRHYIFVALKRFILLMRKISKRRSCLTRNVVLKWLESGPDTCAMSCCEYLWWNLCELAWTQGWMMADTCPPIYLYAYVCNRHWWISNKLWFD